MTDVPRRRFLQVSAGVVTGLSLSSCADERAAETSAGGLDRPTLEAVGRIALPTGVLGEAGVGRVVGEFLAWLAAFEPVSERDHGYGTAEVRYGPPHPGPLWGAQLEALSLEAHKRFGSTYAGIDIARQREILERQLPEHLPEELPYAGAATHVAIGLIAWFYATPEANDLALRARIGRQGCRGLASGSAEPEPLQI
ncbi:MAG: hypothetical protein OEW35_19045 [Gammaproteobacteria bacterium]|nr:hypothetical protein [Gammaproteobacteria bacterium]MDH4256255.1 hypothetical protein [Gammaproteobacteria bacterium]MDH5310632.1 hypothetical protein [Gammaproteobacteria bacterium]